MEPRFYFFVGMNILFLGAMSDAANEEGHFLYTEYGMSASQISTVYVIDFIIIAIANPLMGILIDYTKKQSLYSKIIIKS